MHTIKIPFHLYFNKANKTTITIPPIGVLCPAKKMHIIHNNEIAIFNDFFIETGDSMQIARPITFMKPVMITPKTPDNANTASEALSINSWSNKLKINEPRAKNRINDKKSIITIETNVIFKMISPSILSLVSLIKI